MKNVKLDDDYNFPKPFWNALNHLCQHFVMKHAAASLDIPVSPDTVAETRRLKAQWATLQRHTSKKDWPKLQKLVEKCALTHPWNPNNEKISCP